MTSYLFVLGKNWILSIAELIICLRNSGIEAHIVDYSRTACVIDSERELTDSMLLDIQSSLGGCYKTGRLVETYDMTTVKRAFPKEGAVNARKRALVQSCEWVDRVWGRIGGKNVRFGVSTYPASVRAEVDLTKFTLGLDESIKKRLLKNGAKKAVYYAYEEPDRRDPERPNTALWPQTIARHGLLEPPNAEILALMTETRVYLGKTVAVYDSLFQQHRDEERPFVAAEITTSPKLCRTLLNLAGARAGDTVLDPFCGTGTLLMEAALLDMKCIGIDTDPKAVNGAISNMKWLEEELGDSIEYTILRGDARSAARIVGRTIDAAAFEPELGPVSQEAPNLDTALKTVHDLTQLYSDTLKGLASCLKIGGRIGMTIPVINTAEGAVSLELEEMLRGTGFEVCPMLPQDAISEQEGSSASLRLRPNRERLPERKRGQIVQREVLALVHR